MPVMDSGPLDRIRRRLEATGSELQAARDRVWTALARINRSLELLQKLDRGRSTLTADRRDV